MMPGRHRCPSPWPARGAALRDALLDVLLVAAAAALCVAAISGFAAVMVP